MDRISVKRNWTKLRNLDFYFNITGYTPEEKRTVKNIKSRLKVKLLPKIKIFKDFKVVFGKTDDNDTLGLYIGGSGYNWKPIIVIDIDNTYRYEQEFDLNYKIIMETTILHELAHAIQEKFDIELDEREAESFAENYFKYGIINKFWKEKVAV